MAISQAIQTALQGLIVSQYGLNITGHNVSNANTPNFSRQRANLEPALPDYYPFGAVGRGVEIRGVERVVDEFLNTQLRASTSNLTSQQVAQSAYSRIQTAFNELTENDLSTALDKFFGALHDLSANVDSQPVREAIVQQALSLRTMITELHTSLRDYHQQLDRDVGTLTSKANELMDEIADLNSQIVLHEGGMGVKANDLRDMRDGKLKELSEILNISVFEQPSGAVNVTTTGMPLVLYDRAFHLATRVAGDDNLRASEVYFEDDGSPLVAREGKLPATIDARDNIVKGFLDDLDQFAADFIFQFNRVHSQGVGSLGLTAVTSENATVDATVPLSQINLGFTPPAGTFQVVNGSLTINVVSSVTGEDHAYRIPIDEDGIGADMSLNDLVTAINTTAGLSAAVQASVDASGHLRLTSLNPAVSSFYFSEDTSGVLATLGINGFFTGHDAATMDVSAQVQADSRYLAAGLSSAPGDNRNLLRLIDLRDAAVADSGSKTFEGLYRSIVGRMGTEAQSADTAAEVQSDVVTKLQNERDTVSGVSMDEEMTNMISFQRAYQAAARVITASDAMIQSLLNV
jgi:flagellar hook-associated protein 1 FlgK